MSETNLAAVATSTPPVQLGWLGMAGASILLALLVALVGTVLVHIWQGKIDLSKLLSEENGDASMSRFQLLVFTFVIALGMVVGLVRTGDFPDLSEDHFILLGISAGSYLGAKVVQKAREARTAAPRNPATPDHEQ